MPEIKKVTIYSTPTCPFCKMAKAFLKENNVSFEDKNVADDESAREEMMKKTHQLGVPVLDIDGKIIVGFDKQAISETLGLKKK
ncbi:MAG: glutathione S-transferase N-terminal domain-containing protein [Nanoarchaeota archaeon]|nr:glutathione S-transferase N-terminal domain-containing protein [Nanoarchaeota archaeon]